jgi:diguanylate cyclase (GGDEF)-like protein
MSLATARLRAEAWRSSIAENVVHFGTFSLQATISIGVATFPGDGKTRDELIDAADHALYRAKGNGRNRVEFAEASAPH